MLARPPPKKYAISWKFLSPLLRDLKVLREVLEGTPYLQDDIARVEACPEVKEVQKHAYKIQSLYKGYL